MDTVSLTSPRLGNVALLSALTLLSVSFAFVGPRPEARFTSVALQQAASESGVAGEQLTSETLDPDVLAALEIAARAKEAEAERPHVVAATQAHAAERVTAPGPVNAAADQVVSHVIKPGETLFSIWKKYGAPIIGGSKAAEAWKEAGVSHQSLRPGDELRLTIENGDIAQVVRRLRNGDQITLTGSSRGGYTAALKKVQVSESQLNAGGIIMSSFAASARSAQVPHSVVDELVDLFSGRIEFRRDLQPGDSFAVTYKQRYVEGKPLEADGDAVESASITVGGTMYAVIRYVGKTGRARYFDEQGRPIGNYFLRYPVQFSHVSSVFSNARLHPILQRLRPHNGVDFAAPIGTPVRAVADGVVTEAGFRGAAGNMIHLSHGPRYSTAYLHLAKIVTGVRPGTRVTRGQVIGTVGMTGLASGPHLHFSLYDRGRYVDPLKTALPSLSVEHDRIPHAVLTTALNALRGTQQAVVLASNAPASRNRKFG
jgi:murein DD-endopeptidase MepM/ murein hydrolase activator NlpD